MKKTIASFFAIATSAAAFAHSNALPHTHEGSQTNWIPAIASFIALVAGTTLVLRAAKRKAAQNKR